MKSRVCVYFVLAFRLCAVALPNRILLKREFNFWQRLLAAIRFSLLKAEVLRYGSLHRLERQFNEYWSIAINIHSIPEDPGLQAHRTKEQQHQLTNN